MNALFGNAWLLLTIATLCWGGNAVAGKLASSEWLPFTLTMVRWGCATLLLLPFAWRALVRDWPVLRRHLPLMFLLGGVGMCLFNLLMYLALNHTSAINVSIEQAAMPLLIMIANFVVFSQRVRALQLVGLALSIVGVLITTTGGRPLDFFSGGLNRGDALMLLACVFYAGYTFGLRWKPPLHWMSFMWTISVAAFAMTLPFAAWELSGADQPMPGPGGLARARLRRRLPDHRQPDRLRARGRADRRQPGRAVHQPGAGVRRGPGGADPRRALRLVPRRGPRARARRHHAGRAGGRARRRSRRAASPFGTASSLNRPDAASKSITRRSTASPIANTGPAGSSGRARRASNL